MVDGRARHLVLHIGRRAVDSTAVVAEATLQLHRRKLRHGGQRRSLKRLDGVGRADALKVQFFRKVRAAAYQLGAHVLRAVGRGLGVARHLAPQAGDLGIGRNGDAHVVGEHGDGARAARVVVARGGVGRVGPVADDALEPRLARVETARDKRVGAKHSECRDLGVSRRELRGHVGAVIGNSNAG